MNSSRPYIARALYDWLVDNDLTPQIVVNAEVEGVEVPQDFVRNGQIVLNIGVSAVGRFSMNNDAIAFSARFSGKDTQLMVPMEALLAIYARENGVGMVFGQEPMMPEEDAHSTLDGDDGASISEAPSLSAVSAKHQKGSEAGAEEDSSASESDSKDEAKSKPNKQKPKGRPSLRVIK